ncbi:DUF6191 domain-containing protein [Streptomyces sp. NBC_01478]|uniref:DUF6191 domain-containing protein n=1 Tax=Streptomyces sp. NBC_01478 TaxID=2903882 RepID=UPI003FCE96F2
MFEELFSPGRKHTQDEANRLALTRVDVADGDPGRGPIDLESGKVVVRLPEADARTDPDPDPDPDAGSGDDADADPSAEPPATSPEAPESGRPPT